MQLIRIITSALAALLLAGVLAGPAAAWDMHAVVHVGAPVAASEHHHHNDDGSIEVAVDVDLDQDKDSKDGGHDHMPSLAGAWASVPPATPDLAPPFISSALHEPFVGRTPLTLIPEPQIRPPRFS